MVRILWFEPLDSCLMDKIITTFKWVAQKGLRLPRDSNVAFDPLGPDQSSYRSNQGKREVRARPREGEGSLGNATGERFRPERAEPEARLIDPPNCMWGPEGEVEFAPVQSIPARPCACPWGGARNAGRGQFIPAKPERTGWDAQHRQKRQPARTGRRRAGALSAPVNRPGANLNLPFRPTPVFLTHAKGSTKLAVGMRAVLKTLREGVSSPNGWRPRV